MPDAIERRIAEMQNGSGPEMESGDAITRRIRELEAHPDDSQNLNQLPPNYRRGFFQTLGEDIGGIPKHMMDFLSGYPANTAAESLSDLTVARKAHWQRATEAYQKGDIGTAAAQAGFAFPVFGPQLGAIADNWSRGNRAEALANLTEFMAPFMAGEGWRLANPNTLEGMAMRGAVKGGWQEATQTTPLSRFGVDINVSKPLARGGATYGAARAIGVPEGPAIGAGVVSGGYPIVRAAVQGAQRALAQEKPSFSLPTPEPGPFGKAAVTKFGGPPEPEYNPAGTILPRKGWTPPEPEPPTPFPPGKGTGTKYGGPPEPEYNPAHQSIPRGRFTPPTQESGAAEPATPSTPATANPHRVANQRINARKTALAGFDAGLDSMDGLTNEQWTAAFQKAGVSEPELRSAETKSMVPQEFNTLKSGATRLYLALKRNKLTTAAKLSNMTEGDWQAMEGNANIHSTVKETLAVRRRAAAMALGKH